jgi:acyl carrier protein
MTDDPVLAKILDLARERFGARAAALEPGDDLYAALAIDSMQAMDLLNRLEQAFRIEIPDYELHDVRTIASIVEIVRKRL